MKKTRKMIASLVAIVICFAMLIGTTYAWFTDSVVNTNNIIKSGNVDVELYHTNKKETDEKVDGATKLFVNVNGDEMLWEPGASTSETFTIKNEGSLALKYEFSIKALSKTLNANAKSLLDVLTLTVKEGSASEEKFDFGHTFKGTIIAGAEPKTYTATINWASTANDNDYMNLKVLLGIELVATQFTVEEDGTGSEYDKEAQLPEISLPTLLPEEATEITVNGAGVNAGSATLPKELVEELKESGVEAISFGYTDPVVDEENKIANFDSVEFYDQDGNPIDLESNDKTFTVTFTVPALANMPVEIKHEDKFIDSVVADANGVITYEATHFCNVEIKVTYVSTANELIEALKAGKNVALADDITINKDEQMGGSGYGKAGITLNGQTLLGNNHTLRVNGANGTWDCAINIKSGTVKDIVVAGAMRGIFCGGANGDIYMEDLSFDGVVYTYNSDAGNKNYGVYATNCTFNGWTSFSDCHKEVIFTACKFSQGSGYAYCRPYNEASFVNCEFETGYTLEARARVTLESCTIGGVALTTENLENLTKSSNVTIK